MYSSTATVETETTEVDEFSTFTLEITSTTSEMGQQKSADSEVSTSKDGVALPRTINTSQEGDLLSFSINSEIPHVDPYPTGVFNPTEADTGGKPI